MLRYILLLTNGMIAIRGCGDEKTKVRVGGALGTLGTRKAEVDVYAHDFKFLSHTTKVSLRRFNFQRNFFFLEILFS